MDNHGIERPTNDWERYEQQQVHEMQRWRAEEHNARMEVLMFEPEVKDVGHDCEGPADPA